MIINWNEELYYNTLQRWSLTVGALIVYLVLISLFKQVFIKSLKRWSATTKTALDDILISITDKSIIPILYFVGTYIAIRSLQFPPIIEQLAHSGMLLITTFYVLRIITVLVKRIILSATQKYSTEMRGTQAGGLAMIANSIIWITGAIFLIDNLGYNVSTLIAGLGIGGIAIALAAQTILGDLFSYFVIFFDKPFEIGDFIIVDDKMGVVERIGIKTTRLRTLEGDQLVCSNTFLTNARVHNYKRMAKRRVVFKLGVTYQTPYQKLVSIPEMVKEIITLESDVEFDRGHFSGYGSFSLDFEFVYYISDSDYNLYMDKQQQVYFNIFSAFEKNGIEFAYPTQTVYTQPLQQIASDASSFI